MACLAFAARAETAVRCDVLLADKAPTTREHRWSRTLRGAGPTELLRRLTVLEAEDDLDAAERARLQSARETLEAFAKMRTFASHDKSAGQIVFSEDAGVSEEAFRLSDDRLWFVARGVLLSWDISSREVECWTSPTDTVGAMTNVAGFPLLYGSDGHFVLQKDGSASVGLPDYGLERETAAETVLAVATSPRRVVFLTADGVRALNHVTQALEKPFAAVATKFVRIDTVGTRWLFGLDASGALWRGDFDNDTIAQVPLTAPALDLTSHDGQLLLLDAEGRIDALDPDRLTTRSLMEVDKGPRGFDAFANRMVLREDGALRIVRMPRANATTRDEDDAVALAGRLLVRSGHRMNVGFLSRIFWAYHTQQHTDRRNKVLHYVMNAQLLGLLAAGAITREAAFFWLAPTAYLVGWAGHLLYEPNDPATWKYPVGSFLTEFELWWHILRGNRGREETRYDAVAPMRRGPTGKPPSSTDNPS